MTLGATTIEIWGPSSPGSAPARELGELPLLPGSKGHTEEGPKREELAEGGRPLQRSRVGAGGGQTRWKRRALLFLRCVGGEVNFCMPNFSPVRDPNHKMGLWFGFILLEIALETVYYCSNTLAMTSNLPQLLFITVATL